MSEPLGFVVLARRPGQPDEIVSAVFPAYPTSGHAATPSAAATPEPNFRGYYRFMDNIFDSDCVALVNATNIQGVMGGGIAAQFRDRFPEMHKMYQQACAAGKHRMGEMLLFEENGKTIINFPTMEYPGMRADLGDIENGLKDLRALILTLSDPERSAPVLDSVAIPALGCGIGRLNWTDVEALIQKYLGDVDGLRVELYPPDAPKYTL